MFKIPENAYYNGCYSGAIHSPFVFLKERKAFHAVSIQKI